MYLYLKNNTIVDIKQHTTPDSEALYDTIQEVFLDTYKLGDIYQFTESSIFNLEVCLEDGRYRKHVKFSQDNGILGTGVSLRDASYNVAYTLEEGIAFRAGDKVYTRPPENEFGIGELVFVGETPTEKEYYFGVDTLSELSAIAFRFNCTDTLYTPEQIAWITYYPSFSPLSTSKKYGVSFKVNKLDYSVKGNAYMTMSLEVLQDLLNRGSL